MRTQLTFLSIGVALIAALTSTSYAAGGKGMYYHTSA